MISKKNICLSEPPNIKLPFIAYGSFKPEELRFNQIKSLVESYDEIVICGDIKDKDGIPIFMLDTDVSFTYEAFVIKFKEGREKDAYEKICANEPQSYYQWGLYDDNNILLGKPRLRGAENFDLYSWSFRYDPYFAQGMKAVEDIHRSPRRLNNEHVSHITEFFFSSAAYTLLWTIIERFCAIKYGNLGPQDKLKKLAAEPCVLESLRKLTEQGSPIYRSDSENRQLRPSQDGSNPLKTINYYYGIRSNMIHRGKDAFNDIERIDLALENLTKVFKDVLNAHGHVPMDYDMDLDKRPLKT